MSKCFNKECDYCKDNECRFGREDNAGCHWYIGEPLKEPLSKKFQDYAEEELPKLREQIKQKDQRIAELEKELKKTKCLYNDSIDREIFLTDEERRTYYKNVELKKENAELKQKLENAIVPKFKKGQNIYFFEKFNNEVIKGEIDMFDYYTERYLVFINDNFGSDWYLEEELYAIKKEALRKVEEV